MSQLDDEKSNGLQLNVKFNVIPKTKLKEFTNLFNGYTTGLVRSEPGNFVMTPLYAKHADRLYRMEPRADDIWLLTFPKCGINLVLIIISSNVFKTVLSSIQNCNQVQLGLLNCCGYLWTTVTRRKPKKLLYLFVLLLQSIQGKSFFTALSNVIISGNHFSHRMPSCHHKIVNCLTLLMGGLLRGSSKVICLFICFIPSYSILLK